jgi:predicted phosphate transport protein (TIGR00153 family)
MSITSQLADWLRSSAEKLTAETASSEEDLLHEPPAGYSNGGTQVMRKLFVKRQNIFLQLIHDQAAITLEGMEALKSYMGQKDPNAAALLQTKEKEADEARRILIFELNKTFITPFDREDIFALSRTIDDVLDYAYSTVNEMEILKVRPTPFMERIASLLRDAAYELLMAVDRLQEHPGVANEHAQRAKALENRVEDVYREALADLFSGAEDIKHVIKMLKSREVYRHLSNAADRGDDAANVIADIVVKIA